MSDNIESIHKLPKHLERLLKEKEEEYGSFSKTSYVMQKIIEGYLSAYNGYVVKAPKNIWGILNIDEKNWRSITNKKYKKDTYDDINGYAECNRGLALNDRKK
jgi:hypothetical protein|tara:strand:+ start:2914 stop:3222 length:309 start_codon:yes stop_codon:yes gene_type:complete